MKIPEGDLLNKIENTSHEKEGVTDNQGIIGLIGNDIIASKEEINRETLKYKDIEKTPEWSSFVDRLFNPLKKFSDNIKNIVDKLGSSSELSQKDLIKIGALTGLLFLGDAEFMSAKSEGGVSLSSSNTETLSVKSETVEDEKIKLELVNTIKNEIKELVGKEYGISKQKYSEILGQHELLRDYNYEIGEIPIGYSESKPLNYEHKNNFTNIGDLSFSQEILDEEMKFIKIGGDLFDFRNKTFSSEEEMWVEKEKIYTQNNQIKIDDLKTEDLKFFLKRIKELDLVAQFYEFIQKTNVHHEEEHYLFDQYLFKEGYDGPTKIEMIDLIRKELLSNDFPDRKKLLNELMEIYDIDKQLVLKILQDNTINFDDYDLAIPYGDKKDYTKKDKGVLQVGFLLDEYLARVYNAGKGFDYTTMEADFNNHPSKDLFKESGFEKQLDNSFIDLNKEEADILKKMKINGVNILDIGNNRSMLKK